MFVVPSTSLVTTAAERLWISVSCVEYREDFEPRIEQVTFEIGVAKR